MSTEKDRTEITAPRDTRRQIEGLVQRFARNLDTYTRPDYKEERVRVVFIGFTFFVSAMLIVLWIGRIVPAMASGQFPPEQAGLTTMVTQGFDLGMVVPLMLSTGILLWKRSQWGYLLTSISMSYGLLMSIVLPAWIAVPLFQDGKINLIEAIPFLAICLVGLVFAGLFFRNVQEEKAS